MNPGAGSTAGTGASTTGETFLRWNSENMQTPDDGSAGVPFAPFAFLAVFRAFWG
jgi:hypothetical protein